MSIYVKNIDTKNRNDCTYNYMDANKTCVNAIITTTLTKSKNGNRHIDISFQARPNFEMKQLRIKRG